MKGAVPRVGRNDPCPCGSGKKYKHCHESKADGLTSWQKVDLVIVAVTAIAGLVLAISNRSDEPRPTGVWSAEHGHYH